MSIDIQEICENKEQFDEIIGSVVGSVMWASTTLIKMGWCIDVDHVKGHHYVYTFTNAKDESVGILSSNCRDFMAKLMKAIRHGVIYNVQKKFMLECMNSNSYIGVKAVLNFIDSGYSRFSRTLAKDMKSRCEVAMDSKEFNLDPEFFSIIYADATRQNQNRLRRELKEHREKLVQRCLQLSLPDSVEEQAKQRRL